MMKLFKKGEFGLLWPFYLDALISPLFFFVPAFLVLYFNGIGLTFFQIGILMAISNLTSLLFEVPTGAIADLYGRKFSVLTGFALEGIGFISLFFIQEYSLMILAFGFLGMASTFSSGAKEAWVIDLVRSSKKNLQKGYFTKSQSIDGTALILSGFIGAYAVKTFGLSIIWIATGISYFLAFFILLLAKEKKIPNRTKDFSVIKITKNSLNSISYSRKHKILFSFLLAAALLIFASNLEGQLAWITFLQDLGMQEYTFGYLWSAMAAMAVIAPLVASKLIKPKKERQTILLLIILGAITLLLVIFVNQMLPAIALLLTVGFFAHARRPAERIYFHRFVPSKLRASVGSVESMIISLTGIIAVPVAGLLVDHVGARYTIMSSAVVMLIAAIVYYKIKETAE